MEGDIIVDYTPFIYQNGKEYYFRIIDRDSNVYHKIQVYERKMVEKGILWWKRMEEDYVEFGSYGLMSTNYDSNILKYELDKILKACLPSSLEGWDGFVGDVDPDLKKAIIREAKIKKLI